MSNTIAFLPWSSAPHESRRRNRIPRPAPQSDHRLLAWDENGLPAGPALVGALESGHGSSGNSWPPPTSGSGSPGNGWPPPPEAGLSLTPNVSTLAKWARSGGSNGRRVVGLGYTPDVPDWRDRETRDLVRHVNWMMEHGKKRSDKRVPKSRLGGARGGRMPARWNLGDGGMLSPVEDQLDIGSCTANAVVGMIEYFLRIHAREELDMSRMFLYKCARRLMNVSGDTGAHIRTVIKALRLFGVPPESRWPYRHELLDVEPDPFTFSYAGNFKAVSYACLDIPGSRPAEVLERVKKAVIDGFPVAFGFTVFKSIENMAGWVIPFPTSQLDEVKGGHAVLAVGYDESIDCGAGGTGALIIRNSWGTGWGDLGYGYLPYGYLMHGLAQDFWTLYSQDWVSLEQFSPGPAE
jgi:hypothetical protein